MDPRRLVAEHPLPSLFSVAAVAAVAATVVLAVGAAGTTLTLRVGALATVLTLFAAGFWFGPLVSRYDERS